LDNKVFDIIDARCNHEVYETKFTRPRKQQAKLQLCQFATFCKCLLSHFIVFLFTLYYFWRSHRPLKT